jgi:CubicO group peptidase (beta-lactamase class C family)
MNVAVDRTVTLDNWMDDPHQRWAFQHVRELVPTARIANDDGPRTILPVDLVDLDRVELEAADGSTITIADHLDATNCDGICVVHDGHIVMERYLNGMTERTPHLLMSVSKSFCGAALGISIDCGLLRADDLVCDVAPEFTGTNLDGATVQHVIDMSAGTDFVEDYDAYLGPNGVPDDDHVLIQYERQAGYRRLGPGPVLGTLGHFRTYGLARPHGDRFDYRSPLTNIAARIVEVVNDLPYHEVVSRDLWAPLGQEFDADVMLDPLGHPVVEGGMSCTLRDLARFGLAMLDDGTIGGRQVLPAAWVDDTRLGDESSITAYERYATVQPDEEGWHHYRNAWWVMDRGVEYSGLGIFGQFCWVHRPSRTVIARFSTYPTALPYDTSAETMRAFHSIASALTD